MQIGQYPVRHLAALLVSACLTCEAAADQALIAVATNFRAVMSELVTSFEASNDHQIRFTAGATGALYAQVRSGAPFDAVFAADQRRPLLLEDEGFAVAGTRFTYAIGQLVLWSPNPAFDLEDGVAILRSGRFRKLAMANPRVAPYGLAAHQVLERLGLDAELKDRIVQGENIAQTHAMIATGSADLGFTALSFVTPFVTPSVSFWRIPAELYSPIRQDAVLMARAKDNDAARAFFAYAGSAQAREIIRSHGYLTDPPHSNPAGTIRVKP